MADLMDCSELNGVSTQEIMDRMTEEPHNFELIEDRQKFRRLAKKVTSAANGVKHRRPSAAIPESSLSHSWNTSGSNVTPHAIDSTVTNESSVVFRAPTLQRELLSNSRTKAAKIYQIFPMFVLIGNRDVASCCRELAYHSSSIRNCVQILAVLPSERC